MEIFAYIYHKLYILGFRKQRFCHFILCSGRFSFEVLCLGNMCHKNPHTLASKKMDMLRWALFLILAKVYILVGPSRLFHAFYRCFDKRIILINVG